LVGSFDDPRIAEQAREALFDSLGVRRYVRRAFISLVPILLLVLVVDIAFTAMKRPKELDTAAVAAALMSSAATAQAGQPGIPAAALAPTSVEAQKEAMRARLTAQLTDTQSAVPADYEFNPRITVPAVAAPKLQCEPAAMPQKTTAK
jgi:hypothetical protein